MDRTKIKEDAKKWVQENFKEFWKGYFVILIISFLIEVGIHLLFFNRSEIYYTLTLLSSFFTMTLNIGFSAYLLKGMRKKEWDRLLIFNYIGQVLPIVSISLLATIISFFWGIFFIIPGLIVAISYSMANYIYIDHPSWNALECLEKSKEIMKGYKWDYFIFNLSFLGWILISFLTFGFFLLWTIPYITIAELKFYEFLKKEKQQI